MFVPTAVHEVGLMQLTPIENRYAAAGRRGKGTTGDQVPPDHSSAKPCVAAVSVVAGRHAEAVARTRDAVELGVW